jgi:hypothetical protein
MGVKYLFLIPQCLASRFLLEGRIEMFSLRLKGTGGNNWQMSPRRLTVFLAFSRDTQYDIVYQHLSSRPDRIGSAMK